VAVVATHASHYAQIDKAAGAAFVDRVKATALNAFKSSSGPSCLVVFAADNGELIVTIGDQSVSQPLPAS
jgi:hypothetical protein